MQPQLRSLPTLDFQRNKPRRPVNQIKFQSQHFKLLQFLPAGSSRAHTLTLTRWPLYQPLPSVYNPVKTSLATGKDLVTPLCRRVRTSRDTVAQQWHQLWAYSPVFPFSPDVFIGIFTLGLFFLCLGHMQWNCPGTAFLNPPSNSSSGLNSNDVLIAFTHVAKSNMSILMS